MLITCAYCNGSGRWYRGYSTKCPVCNGVGQVDVPSNFVRCGFCGGTGRQYRGYDTRCNTCNGYGVCKPKILSEE